MKNKLNYIIAGIIVIFVSYIVIKDRSEKFDHTSIKEIEKDTCLMPTAPVDEKILSKIDSVDVDYEKMKREKKEHLLKEKRIHDSIKMVKQKFRDEQKKFEEEKKLMKERYEKQIDNIYKYNNVSRGGPEDTIKSEKD